MQSNLSQVRKVRSKVEEGLIIITLLLFISGAVLDDLAAKGMGAEL